MRSARGSCGFLPASHGTTPSHDLGGRRYCAANEPRRMRRGLAPGGGGVVDIVQAGDPVLRRRAEPVSLDALATPFVQQLVATMVQTMRAAPGVGLAAPQVGESLRILVMEDDNLEQLAAMSEARR